VSRAPVLLVALAREHLIARRSWQAGQRWPQAPCQARWYVQQGSPFLLLETGVGAAAAERALSWLLPGTSGRIDNYHPSLLISAGFSGALQPGQRVGDLVLASEVIDETGQAWPLSVPGPLRELLTSAYPSVKTGRILTTGALVEEPSRKRALGRDSGAVAVDMESAVLARRCHERGLPLVCLRVISDDMDTVLSPQLAALLRGGQASAGRVAGALLRRPGMVRELWRLAGQTRLAARQLAGPLNQLLQASRAAA
jgi:adenosylhomocysteine nucleosidase